ncbi:hypothetical protein A1Q1_01783 [Trichosporon asahii var. asahii CBS 2479]|uniref:DNA ligase ATP-dependent N-terminal domain-containing protein n=1 Tax=Trichosporon asahii var. asahii (strain ATCC 90039 / CBS 2479 / JCM 2466 / KCTC 7840 / NBRC 103889/ NCYC 2677 / UAMH 7654) TaxID=1186058 RepID=J6EWY7_TRIAS|nr:hypothetical protein A1Q1_01783 [Trichosporon asahii var. asahii CBS 2479]EJT49134.1 hypothetical protein A1Q1_01783 [Trichosporon asahii var. asahii CBS 2479]
MGDPPMSKRRDQKEKIISYTPEEIFGAWISKQAQPLVPGTTKKLFRLLFPHEGARRRYDIKETRLASLLEQTLGIKGLTRWDAVSLNGVRKTGCLGEEPNGNSTMTIGEVDALLDQLAAGSSWSQLSQIPSDRPTQMTILQRLFRDSGMSPYALSVLTQIILRDLRPLLFPLPLRYVGRPELLIRETISSAPNLLTVESAMFRWDTTMAKLYREGKGNIDWCATKAEEIRMSEQRMEVAPGPILGINVKVGPLLVPY